MFPKKTKKQTTMIATKNATMTYMRIWILFVISLLYIGKQSYCRHGGGFTTTFGRIVSKSHVIWNYSTILRGGSSSPVNNNNNSSTSTSNQQQQQQQQQNIQETRQVTSQSLPPPPPPPPVSSGRKIDRQQQQQEDQNIQISNFPISSQNKGYNSNNQQHNNQQQQQKQWPEQLFQQQQQQQGQQTSTVMYENPNYDGMYQDLNQQQQQLFQSELEISIQRENELLYQLETVQSTINTLEQREKIHIQQLDVLTEKIIEIETQRSYTTNELQELRANCTHQALTITMLNNTINNEWRVKCNTLLSQQEQDEMKLKEYKIKLLHASEKTEQLASLIEQHKLLEDNDSKRNTIVAKKKLKQQLKEHKHQQQIQLQKLQVTASKSKGGFFAWLFGWNTPTTTTTGSINPVEIDDSDSDDDEYDDDNNNNDKSEMYETARITLLQALQTERTNVEELENSIIEYQKKNITILEQLQSYEKEINQLNDLITNYEENKIVLQAAIRQLRNEIKLDIPKQNKLVSELTNATNTIQQLKNETIVLQANHTNEIHQLKVLVRTKQEQLLAVESNLTIVSMYIEKLEERLAEYAITRRDIKNNNNNYTNYKQQIDTLQYQRDTIQEQYNAIQLEHIEYKNLIQLLTKERTQLQKQYNVSNNKIQQYQSNENSLRTAYAQLSINITKLQQENILLEKQCTIYKTNATSIYNEMTQLYCTAQDEVLLLRNEITNVTNQYNTIKNQLYTVEQERLVLQKQLLELNTTVKGTVEKLQVAQTKIGQVEDTLQSTIQAKDEQAKVIAKEFSTLAVEVKNAEENWNTEKQILVSKVQQISNQRMLEEQNDIKILEQKKFLLEESKIQYETNMKKEQSVLEEEKKKLNNERVTFELIMKQSQSKFDEQVCKWNNEKEEQQKDIDNKIRTIAEQTKQLIIMKKEIENEIAKQIKKEQLVNETKTNTTTTMINTTNNNTKEELRQVQLLMKEKNKLIQELDMKLLKQQRKQQQQQQQQNSSDSVTKGIPIDTVQQSSSIVVNDTIIPVATQTTSFSSINSTSTNATTPILLKANTTETPIMINTNNKTLSSNISRPVAGTLQTKYTTTTTTGSAIPPPPPPPSSMKNITASTTKQLQRVDDAIRPSKINSSDDANLIQKNDRIKLPTPSLNVSANTHATKTTTQQRVTVPPPPRFNGSAFTNTTQKRVNLPTSPPRGNVSAVTSVTKNTTQVHASSSSTNKTQQQPAFVNPFPLNSTEAKRNVTQITSTVGNRHPTKSRSIAFRGIRKAFAKATGMHGVFTKSTTQVSTAPKPVPKLNTTRLQRYDNRNLTIRKPQFNATVASTISQNNRTLHSHLNCKRRMDARRTAAIGNLTQRQNIHHNRTFVPPPPNRTLNATNVRQDQDQNQSNRNYTRQTTDSYPKQTMQIPPRPPLSQNVSSQTNMSSTNQKRNTLLPRNNTTSQKQFHNASDQSVNRKVAFRGFRKFLSKTTGMHGVFSTPSSKLKTNTSQSQRDSKTNNNKQTKPVQQQNQQQLKSPSVLNNNVYSPRHATLGPKQNLNQQTATTTPPQLFNNEPRPFARRGTTATTTLSTSTTTVSNSGKTLPQQQHFVKRVPPNEIKRTIGGMKYPLPPPNVVDTSKGKK